MPFITFDYKCSDPNCAGYEERLVLRKDMDAQRCNEPDCTAIMRRLPAGTRTTFKFADTKLKD